MPRFVIDCGRGDSGRFGGRDVDPALVIGTRVAQLLGEGATLARAGDPSRARDAGADVYIAVHAGGASRRGSETWIHPRAGQSSLDLAAAVQHELAALGAQSGVRAAEFAALTPERLSARTAACLVEIENHRDADGARRLREPNALEAVAQAIARGAGTMRAVHSRYGQVFVDELASGRATIGRGDRRQVLMNVPLNRQGGSIRAGGSARWLAGGVASPRLGARFFDGVDSGTQQPTSPRLPDQFLDLTWDTAVPLTFNWDNVAMGVVAVELWLQTNDNDVRVDLDYTFTIEAHGPRV